MQIRVNNGQLTTAGGLGLPALSALVPGKELHWENSRLVAKNPVVNGPTVLFEDSFETDAPNTTPPTGWTIGEGSGFRVITAANEYAGTSGNFTGVDGLQLIEGVGSNTSSIRRSIDITGYENSNLLFSMLANDGGSLDTTLEAGDILRFQYAFRSNNQIVPSTWNTAIEVEADFAPDNAMVFLSSAGTTINGGGLTTLWIRIWQDVDNVEEFVVDKVRVETV